MSKAAVENLNCTSFFSDLALAKRRVLMLGCDGAVARFSPDRHLQDLFQTIMTDCSTRLIMVSGRPAHAVAALLDLKGQPEIWGADGLERLHPDGRYEGVAVRDESLVALANAEDRLRSVGLGDFLETKPSAVAVQWRGIPRARAIDIRSIASRILAPLAPRGLVLVEFDYGVELRLRSADKGDVVRTVLAEVGPDVPVAFLGDDATDESAFHVLNGRGLTALVRRTYRFTAAQRWLAPPQYLYEFLSSWIDVCGGSK